MDGSDCSLRTAPLAYRASLAERVPSRSQMRTPTSWAAHLPGNPRAGDIWRLEGCGSGLCVSPVGVPYKLPEDLHMGRVRQQALSPPHPYPFLSRRD